jgi:alkaline phosphatase D
MDYRAWGFTQEDNFCRVAVDKAASQIVVTACDNQGRAIPVVDFSGKTATQSILQLAPW